MTVNPEFVNSCVMTYSNSNWSGKIPRYTSNTLNTTYSQNDKNKSYDRAVSVLLLVKRDWLKWSYDKYDMQMRAILVGALALPLIFHFLKRHCSWNLLKRFQMCVN